MGDLELPAPVDAPHVLTSTPTRAATFANNLRAVTVQVKDVQEWAQAQGVPAGWQGDAREAADHTTTRFARRVDISEAALDRAVVATDRFEDRLARLTARRTRLQARRTTLNDEIDQLRTAIRDNVPTGATIAAWSATAADLRARASALVPDITSWNTDAADAEADYVRALRGVDEISEGRRAASDPARPDPDALTRGLRGRLDDPAALAAWWRTLSRAQKQALLTEHPHLVGNAGGVPAGDRDEANRAALYSDIDRLTRQEADGEITDEERAILANAEVIRAELNKHLDNLDPATGEHLLHLLGYRPGAFAGDGGVVISFGDPDRAAHVSVNVPGMTSEISSLPGNLDDTEALYESALRQSDGTVASVFWLDYDAPSGNPFASVDDLLDLGSVVSPDAADAGGERLSSFIDGLRASDQGEQAHLTTIGHSYGSTTLGHALQDGLPVDDAVLIGSPGVPEHSAADLTTADVWVGAMDNDPVTLLGADDGFGTLGGDPAQETFDARRFETGDGSADIRDGIANHTGYFRGHSLDNMGAIVANKDDEVSLVAERDRSSGDGHYETLPEWFVKSAVVGSGNAMLETAQQAIEDRVTMMERFGEVLSSGFGTLR